MPKLVGFHRNFETNEIIEHKSLNSCARYIGCSPASIHSYIRKEPTYLLKGKYDVILKGWRWHSFTKEDIGRPSIGRRRPIMVLSEKDKLCTIYGSAKEASEKIDVCISEIADRASGRRSSVAKGYRFIWLDEFKGSTEGAIVISEKSKREYENRAFRRKENSIVVLFPNGRKEKYSGMSILSKELNVSKEKLQRYVRKNNGWFENIHIAYL